MFSMLQEWTKRFDMKKGTVTVPLKPEKPPERDWYTERWWLFYTKCPVCNRTRQTHGVTTLFQIAILIGAIKFQSLLFWILGSIIVMTIDWLYRRLEQKAAIEKIDKEGHHEYIKGSGGQDGEI